MTAEISERGIAASGAETRSRADGLLVVGVAGAVAVVHLLTNGRYGLHRDELQFLTDARHLDWGFVAYPPLTPFLEWVLLGVFGLSLTGLRLFSVLAQFLVVVLAGGMARAFGGGRLAQVAAAISVALTPMPLFEGTEFQYTSFDYLWWVLAAWCVVRLLRSDNPRWWLGVGAALGLGMETKYTIVFWIGAIVAGFLLTPARRLLASPWFGAGVGVGVLIFLPNLIWLIRHDWVSYHFLQSIHARDVQLGRDRSFLMQQFFHCSTVATTPLWVAGLVACARSGRYRAVAWMYGLAVAALWLAHGQGYYAAPAYPVLMAMGAFAGERWLAERGSGWRLGVPAVYFTAQAVFGAYLIAVLIPVAAEGPLRDFALAKNANFREELGWDRMLATLAQVKETLPAQEQATTGIFTGNYGETGAVEILGPAYHLPAPISTVNSAWLLGVPANPPERLIVIGLEPRLVERMFSSCYVAARVPYEPRLRNEEWPYAWVYLCGPPKDPWPQFWMEFQRFG